jgi:hypothetical protein
LPATPHVFSRVHDVEVLSFAVGKAPAVAALGAGAAWIFDGTRWREQALDVDSDAEFRAAIFFGRDNRPRLMGALNGRSYYRRYTAAGWNRAADELGRLGRGSELYGVLGHDDPELVCEPGLVCLVKRVSGWRTIDAHAAPVPAIVAAGTAFALHRDKVMWLVGDAWEDLEPARAFAEPRGVWADAATIWVIDGGGALWRLRDREWTEVVHPVSGPRAVWSEPGAVWLVGKGGAASFDGTTWRCARGADAAIDFVAGAAGVTWLAGRSGVFRGDQKAATRSPPG